jgi:hypothetical protein
LLPDYYSGNKDVCQHRKEIMAGKFFFLSIKRRGRSGEVRRRRKITSGEAKPMEEESKVREAIVCPPEAERKGRNRGRSLSVPAPSG